MQRLAIVLTLITAFLSFLLFSNSVFATFSPYTSQALISPLPSSQTREEYIEEIKMQQREVMKAQLMSSLTPTQPTPSNLSTTPTYTPTPITSQSTPKQTATPTPTKKLSPTPTKKLTPTLTKSTPTPTKTPQSVTLTDQQKFMLQAINDYRSSKGLSSVKSEKNTCDFAEIRAKEIVNNFNHDGFRKRIDSKTLPYPSYKSVTENIAMTNDYKKVVQMWINSSGHAENMRKDTPYVCVARNGNYFAYEGWKP